MAEFDVDPLPAEFIERLRRILGGDMFCSAIESFSAIKPTSFRVNRLRAEPDQIRDELKHLGIDPQPVSWSDVAYQVAPQERRLLTESDPFRSGRIYVQNLASMLAPLALAVQAGETILDLAAAPGGKTLQMAAMMENTGTISAVEAIRSRFFKLQANLKLHGATNVATYLKDGRTVGHKTPERFDRVLLDAPCSSEARFRSGDAATTAYWSLRKIKEASRKQIGLIRSALHALRPGGILLYCTCSFAPEENEAVVHTLLETFNGKVEVLPLELPVENVMPGLTSWGKRSYDKSLSRAVRVLPTSEMDAFFLCRIYKSASTIEPHVRQRNSKHRKPKRRP